MDWIQAYLAVETDTRIQLAAEDARVCGCLSHTAIVVVRDCIEVLGCPRIG